MFIIFDLKWGIFGYIFGCKGFVCVNLKLKNKVSIKFFIWLWD